MKKTVYLDHSASTPTDPRVISTMLPYFTEIYGNSSASYKQGRQAENAIEKAREKVAQILNCQPSEIVFTSGGTEGDNLALRGTAWSARNHNSGEHLLTTPVEHDAVSKTIKQLGEKQGFEYSVLPTDQCGLCTTDTLNHHIQDNTSLVSIIYASNEIGTIQPINQLAQETHKQEIIFHTDAVQATGQLTLNTQELQVDLLTLSGHKFYGPKGAGILFVRDGLEIESSQTGGNHERGQRAGTHSTPLIVGLAKALEIAYDEIDKHVAHLTTIRDILIDGVLSNIPEAQLTGHPTQRLPSHTSFVIPGIDSNTLLMHLDMHGIAASSGSACKTGNPEPSEVLLALGYSKDEALGSLRLTVGRQTTEEDISYTVKTLTTIVRKLYNMKVIL